MKVVIINKSDSTGGAAVVSTRLMKALRDAGVDARMLVAEKLTDSPFVELAATPKAIKIPFLAERLKIFMANGMNRNDLFKIDTASDGLPLWNHPLVREADVVCLNWVNQGVLSLQGIRKILDSRTPVVWTMHDMWNFTGICHHAGLCSRWKESCGDCPFLGSKASPVDLSATIWKKKHALYGSSCGHPRIGKLHFVAVSNWLADLARESPLLGRMPLSVIPNAFPIPAAPPDHKDHPEFRIVMGAARLDDPVKGLPILIEATRVLREKYPEEASRMELVTFGNLKTPGALDGVALPHRHLGMLSGENAIRDVYASADAVVSTSLYETLPGTLVEGLAYGCVPVSFDRGGQSDIVDHLVTGYIAERDEDTRKAAENIAEGLVWASRQPLSDMRKRMYESARSRFDASAVAARYISLFRSLLTT